MTIEDIDPFEDIEFDSEGDVVEGAVKADVQVGKGGKFDFTFKGGPGFADPWMPVGFTSLDDAYEVLTSENNQRKLLELFGITAKLNAAFVKKVAEVAPVKPAAAAAPQAAAAPPPGTPEAPGPDWTFKTGIGKNGKPWKAWMPPRGSDEQPVWIR